MRKKGYKVLLDYEKAFTFAALFERAGNVLVKVRSEK